MWGRISDKIAMAIKLVKKGHLSLEKVIEELQMSEEEFVRLLESENVPLM